MTTSYVVRRRSDQKFASGKTRWTVKWVDDVNKARIFTRRSDASNSIVAGDSTEVLPVRIVLA